jgi:hypothetical protein
LARKVWGDRKALQVMARTIAAKGHVERLANPQACILLQVAGQNRRALQIEGKIYAMLCTLMLSLSLCFYMRIQ